jgi:hypothetical protein
MAEQASLHSCSEYTQRGANFKAVNLIHSMEIQIYYNINLLQYMQEFLVPAPT